MYGALNRRASEIVSLPSQCCQNCLKITQQYAEMTATLFTTHCFINLIIYLMLQIIRNLFKILAYALGFRTWITSKRSWNSNESLKHKLRLSKLTTHRAAKGTLHAVGLPCWSRWACGLRRMSVAAPLLGLRVQIPLRLGTFFSCVYSMSCR